MHFWLVLSLVCSADRRYLDLPTRHSPHAFAVLGLEMSSMPLPKGLQLILWRIMRFDHLDRRGGQPLHHFLTN